MSGTDNAETTSVEAVDFNIAIQADRVAPGLWNWEPDSTWRQGRTIFGGITVAAVVNALTSEVRELFGGESGLPNQPVVPTLRTIQYSFAAPLLAEKSTKFEVAIDRRGSSATFVSAAISQDGSVVGRANAVFGVGRDSKLIKAPIVPELDKSLDEAFKFPYIEGITPVFTQQFDMRWAVEELPLQGHPAGIVGGYVRHLSDVSGTAAVVALLDVWPPSVITMVDKPVMASSVALTMHLVADIPEFGSDDWFEFKYETLSAGGGYATELGYLSLRGQVVGWVEQLVAVFDNR